MRVSKQPRAAGLLASCCLLVTLSVACGITLGAGNGETELFKDLTLEGDFFPGGRLTLTLEYAQQYPADILVVCELLAADSHLIRTPVTTPTNTPLPREIATPTDIPIPQPPPTSRFRLADIIREELPANEDGGPVGEATPVPGVLVHEFGTPTTEGNYVIRCLTPFDRNNSISERVTVHPIPTPTPPPGVEARVPD